MDDDADAKMILMAPPPDNWKRSPGRPCIMWVITIQRDLRAYNLTLKQSTWLRTALCEGWCLRMVLRTPSGACQKRRRRRRCPLSDQTNSVKALKEAQSTQLH